MEFLLIAVVATDVDNSSVSGIAVDFNAVVGVPAVEGVPAIAGDPYVAGFPVVADVPAIASLRPFCCWHHWSYWLPPDVVGVFLFLTYLLLLAALPLLALHVCHS